MRTIRRVRQKHRRLRPEFRRGLLPNRTAIESALRELVHEVPGRELVQRWIPRFKTAFCADTWYQALEEVGYEPAGARPVGAAAPTVTMAPLIARGRLRRSLEHFFRELGVRVVTTGEQLTHLGHEKLEQIHSLTEAPERVRSYLQAVAQRIDTLVVPIADEWSGLGGRVQLLAVRAKGRAGLPRLACIRLEGSQRHVRASLVELGIALTGDVVRAETASEKALALIRAM